MMIYKGSRANANIYYKNKQITSAYYRNKQVWELGYTPMPGGQMNMEWWNQMFGNDNLRFFMLCSIVSSIGTNYYDIGNWDSPIQLSNKFRIPITNLRGMEGISEFYQVGLNNFNKFAPNPLKQFVEDNGYTGIRFRAEWTMLDTLDTTGFILNFEYKPSQGGNIPVVFPTTYQINYKGNISDIVTPGYPRYDGHDVKSNSNQNVYIQTHDVASPIRRYPAYFDIYELTFIK